MQPALRELPDGPPAEIVGVLAAVGVVTTLGLMNGRALRHFWFPLILVAHAGLSYWILQASPQSPVDVFLFQQESSAALVRGRNPYTVAYLNVYGPDTPFYAPELIVGRYVTFSFPYFPLSLLLVAPGYLLAGDIRYAHMASLTLAGALIGYSRPGVIAAGAAVLMLFTPRVFLILEVGWTEPVVVLLLAATVFAAMRSPRAMPVVYGLLLAVKQYLVFALPVGYLLARATRRRPLNVLAVGIAVAAAITIPFFLWNPQRFIDSVVTLQFHQPFRLDSLSIPAWLVTQGWRPMSGVVALAAGAAAVPVAWWLTRPTVSGAVTALAFIYFVFFVMNKQAFANYYFFVIAALCCAVATARFDNDRR
jgi:hypothetical protein